MLTFVDVGADPAHEPLLDAFHRGIYLAAFERQREPLEAWRSALRGESPHQMSLRLALDSAPGDAPGHRPDAIVGGVAYERYPRSRCGLVTYMVVAPGARRAGIGRRLQAHAVAALFESGAAAVFGEVDDPRPLDAEPAEVAWRRVERNQRWGARMLDARYVQPALGPGLERDRGLVLIALAGPAPLPAALDGAIPRAFVEELYEVTEGGPPDPEIAFPDRVPLIELRRPPPATPAAGRSAAPGSSP